MARPTEESRGEETQISNSPAIHSDGIIDSCLTDRPKVIDKGMDLLYICPRLVLYRTMT